MRSYEYEYVDNNGKGYKGSAIHDSDRDAIDYYRSLEENGKVKVSSVKNPNGSIIWSGYKYGNRMLPGLQPKLL